MFKLLWWTAVSGLIVMLCLYTDLISDKQFALQVAAYVLNELKEEAENLDKTA